MKDNKTAEVFRETEFARAFLELYDEMCVDYQRMNRTDFAKRLLTRCSKLKETYPERAKSFGGMISHFQNKK